MTQAPRFVARCIRGVEWIAAAEIEGRGLGTVELIGHREVRFSTAGVPAAPSLQLHTADDLLLVCADLPGFDHTRASLERLTETARELDLARSFDLRQQIVGAPGPATMTVVASFLGRRNYSRYEIEAAVARGLGGILPLPYRPGRELSPGEAVLTLRLHLVGDGALFALRVFDQPLHRRIYRSTTRVGALHPPLAAALSLLAGLRPGGRLLDPFCGVGTIPIEASLLEPDLIPAAGDVSAERLVAARANFRAAQRNARLFRSHAARLPLAGQTFDRIASNPPWGRAVEVVGGREGSLAAGSGGELARVLRPDGRAVLLVEGEGADPGSLLEAGMSLRFRSKVSLHGQHPEIWVLTAGGEPGAIDADGLHGTSLARALRLAETLPV